MTEEGDRERCFGPFWKVPSAPAGFPGGARVWPLYQAGRGGQGLRAALPGCCYSPNLHRVMSSQEGASPSDNVPGCASGYKRLGWVSRKSCVPVCFPVSPKSSLSQFHTEGRPRLCMSSRLIVSDEGNWTLPHLVLNTGLAAAPVSSLPISSPLPWALLTAS